MNPSLFKESYEIGGVVLSNVYFDNSGNIVSAQINSVSQIADSLAGFGPLCMVTNQANGETYRNDGTVQSSKWTLVAIAGTLVQKKLTLTAAQIKNLNSSPQELVAAPGAGYALLVNSIVSRLNFGTTAFATNTNMQAYLTTGSIAFSDINNLASTTTHTKKFVPSAVNFLMDENTSLKLTVQTGNPTAGDGTLDVYVSYQVIKL